MRAVQWRFLLTRAVLVVLMLNTQRLLFLPAGNEAQLTCNSTTYNYNFDTICLRLVTHSYVLRNYHVYSIVCNFLFSISPNGDDVDYGNTNFK